MLGALLIWPWILTTVLADENRQHFTSLQGELDFFFVVVSAAFAAMGEGGGSPASLVAEVIWTAVTDGTTTLRYTAGEDARETAANRKALDDEAFIGGIKEQLGL